MKHKTAELKGALLDFAVALALSGRSETVTVSAGVLRINGLEVELRSDGGAFCPSARWAEGGPIIERERIALEFEIGVDDWTATHPHGLDGMPKNGHGETVLQAAMRAFVRAKLGDEVELPGP